MQFQHVFAAGQLMQAVDILGDHSFQFSFPFQFRETKMGHVGFGALHDQLVAVETVEFLRLCFEEAVTDDGLRRILVFQVVKAVDAAEVRDPAFCRYAGTAEEDDVVAVGDPLLQSEDVVVHDCRPFKLVI